MLSGLQKLTLLDYPGLVACTVFTSGCNLRCPFCHNASLALPERQAMQETLQEDELLAFLRKRRGVLDGVAVTGGEPLLHERLPELLKKIKALGYKVKLDTNGTFPDKLRALAEAGLIDRAAMDIKAAPARYPLAVGVRNVDMGAVKESAAFLLGGELPYEFRTTVVSGIHEPEDFEAIGRWLEGAAEYYLQSFADSGDLISGGGLSAFSPEEMESFADIIRPFIPSVKLRGM